MYAGRLLAARRSILVKPKSDGTGFREEIQRLPRAKSKRGRSVDKQPRIRGIRLTSIRVSGLLCNRSFIAVINIVVVLILSWNTSRLIIRALPKREQVIPHSGRSSFTEPSILQSHQNKGFVNIRQASFRDKYPSTSLSQFGTFDAVYVITNSKCGLWGEVERRANLAQLPVKSWPMVRWKSISLENPPVRLSPDVRKRLNLRKRTAVKTLKRQLAYLDAHRGIWQVVANKSIQRALVLDEAFFPSKRLLASLPPTMSNIDIESIAQQKPWHIVQFRLVRARAHEAVPWSMNPKYHHPVVRANASLGAGMYALSTSGAQYLLQHVNEYRAPLDVEFGLLQAEDVNFVALNACNNNRPRPFCPEMVDVLEGRDSMECLWHRFWETKNIKVFKNFAL